MPRNCNEALSAFRPIRMLDIELSGPLPTLHPSTAQNGVLYRRARALVRLHRQPLGLVDIDLDDGGRLGPTRLADQIWHGLAPTINDHLARDGAPGVEALGVDGLGEGVGPCADELPLPSPAPTVSVVVATRDRPAQLARALDSLVKLTYPAYELIVVDNAPSTSETAELVGRYTSRYPLLRYVREDSAGLSNARNRGLAEAAGEIIAYTDDDVVVDHCWLTAMVGAFGAGAGIIGVSGMQVPAELETASQAWFEGYAGTKVLQRKLYNLSQHRPDDPLFPYTTGMFEGSTMAFRTSVLRLLGAFDPALGAGTTTHGGEDLDIFFRILTTGGTAVVEPAAIIWHFNRRDYEALKRQVRGFGAGLTATVTRQVIDRPARLLELTGKLPAALRYLFAADSAKNSTKDVHYPSELRRLELAGMVAGPLAYLRSRRRARRTEAALTRAAVADAVQAVNSGTR